MLDVLSPGHQVPGLTTFILRWLPVQNDWFSFGGLSVPTPMWPSIAPATLRMGTTPTSPPSSSQETPQSGTTRFRNLRMTSCRSRDPLRKSP